MPASTRRSGSEVGLPKHRLERARAALPVHERAGLVGDRRDREHHVGGAGHVGLAQLEGDHEARGVERGAGRGRVGGVVGVDAADDQAAELAGGQGRDDRVGVAAGGLGQRVDAPGGGGVDARGGVGDRAAAGQQVGQAAGLDRAAVAGAARHPGQPGAGRARRAAAAAVSAPGTVASRSPTRITRVLSMPCSPCVDQGVERRGLVAGRGRRSACRPSCAGRAW